MTDCRQSKLNHLFKTQTNINICKYDLLGNYLRRMSVILYSKKKDSNKYVDESGQCINHFSD